MGVLCWRNIVGVRKKQLYFSTLYVRTQLQIDGHYLFLRQLIHCIFVA